MRTITTSTTRQIAESLANAAARKVASERPKPPKAIHRITATDDEIATVKERVEDAVLELDANSPANRKYDPSALTTTQAKEVIDVYVAHDLAGDYVDEVPVQL